MTSAEIKTALINYFAPPEWAAFDELRDGTGWQCLRSFDLWAINTYPSKGFRTVGVEIKVSRGDFIRELNSPAKRESIETNAMETYFACPLGVLKADEMPEKWGLITVSDKGARLAKRAVQREQIQPDMAFFASVCRRAAEIEGQKRSNEYRAEELKKQIADDEKFLKDKWDKHVAENKEYWLRHAKTDAIEELLGQGVRELKNLMDLELGRSYGNEELAARLVAFYNHVKVGKHIDNRLKNIKSSLLKTIETLDKAGVA